MIGRLSRWPLHVLRSLDRDRTAHFAGWMMRQIGPWLRGHRVAKDQLAMAFPERTEAERDQIAAGMWDNLGRVAVEYAHFDRLWDYDWANRRPGRIVIDQASVDRLARLREVGKPALMFAAHLANWEIPSLAAPAIGREIAIVFRTPRIAFIADFITAARSSEVAAVISAGPDAPLRIRAALTRKWLVGMLIDQHAERGVDVQFFGRTCQVNPMAARFARRFECPIYGARVIRLPGGRFRFEVTEPLNPPRDGEGKIDVAGTMQLITSTIEAWVREYPEQWFWIHRRWR